MLQSTAINKKGYYVNTITRGVRNAFRNGIRTISIVIILGMSVGLALSMLIARQAVEEKITTVKSSIGNTISITPAGMRGFEGGGETLTTDQIESLAEIPTVVGVVQTLSDRLTADTTDLESAIEAGSLGSRAQSSSGLQQSGTANPYSQPRTPSQSSGIFTPPVTITGVDSTDSASIYGGDTVSFVSGSAFDAKSADNVAVIGKDIADKNSLTTGATFQAYGQTISIVGVFDAGNNFANNGVLVPLNTLQTITGLSTAVTGATITVDSVDNMPAALTAVEQALGDSADVVSNETTAQSAVEPLENVKTISTFSTIGALVAGAIVIFMTMVMIVRERRREIGVMKAIGSTNARTMIQFASEAVTLTFLGLVVGLSLSIMAAQPITKTLVNNASASNTTQTQVPGSGMRMNRPGNLAGSALRSAKDVQTSIGLDVIGYGVIATFVIAVVGSAVPAYFISRIRPAEVMRAE